MNRLRETVDTATALALIGATAVAFGIGLFMPWLGIVAFGLLCLIAAVLVARVSA